MATSETQSEDQLNYHTIDEDDAARLDEQQVNREKIQDLEQKIKVLGNETRLRIISLLNQQDLCVHDLSTLLDMSQSAVSHQLKKLQNHEILDRKKEGRVVYYSLKKQSLDETLTKLSVFIDG